MSLELGAGEFSAASLASCSEMARRLEAPVIMMSQNRQADKDRLRAEHDYRLNPEVGPRRQRLASPAGISPR